MCSSKACALRSTHCDETRFREGRAHRQTRAARYSRGNFHGCGSREGRACASPETQRFKYQSRYAHQYVQSLHGRIPKGNKVLLAGFVNDRERTKQLCNLARCLAAPIHPTPVDLTTSFAGSLSNSSWSMSAAISFAAASAEAPSAWNGACSASFRQHTRFTRYLIVRHLHLPSGAR